MIDVEKFKLSFAAAQRAADVNRQTAHNWVIGGHAPWMPKPDDSGNRMLRYDETKAFFVMARLVGYGYCPATAGMIAGHVLDALKEVRSARRALKDPRSLNAEQRAAHAEARDAKFVVMGRGGGGQFFAQARKEPRLFTNVSGVPVMHHEVFDLAEIDRMVRPRVADELGFVDDSDE